MKFLLGSNKFSIKAKLKSWDNYILTLDHKLTRLSLIRRTDFTSRRWFNSKRKTQDKESTRIKRLFKRKQFFKSNCKRFRTNRELQSTLLTAPMWRITKSASGKLKSKWISFSKRLQSISSQEERMTLMRASQSASTTSISRSQSCTSKRIFIWLVQTDTIVTWRLVKQWSKLEEDIRDSMSMCQDSIGNSRKS